MTTPNPVRSGYIKLARKQFRDVVSGGCPLWNERRKLSQWEAWIDLLQVASHTPHTRRANHSDVHLGRGEFLASIRFLARRWLWSEKAVRTFLDWAQGVGRIRAEGMTPAGRTYSIVNYDTYQDGGHTKGTPEAHERHAEDTKRSNGNKGKEKGEPSPPSLNAQARRVDRVLALWDGIPDEVERPAPGLVGTWLKGWDDDDALVSALSEIKDEGNFLNGAGYTTKCLRSKWVRRKHDTPDAPPKRSHSATCTLIDAAISRRADSLEDEELQALYAHHRELLESRDTAAAESMLRELESE